MLTKKNQKMLSGLGLAGLGLGVVTLGYLGFSRPDDSPILEQDTRLEQQIEKVEPKIVSRTYGNDGATFQENYVVKGKELVGDSVIIDHYENCIRETARHLPGGRSNMCLNGDRLTVSIFPAHQPWRPAKVLEGKVTDTELDYYVQRYAINQGLLEEAGLW
jgi:hypothetical protein